MRVLLSLAMSCALAAVGCGTVTARSDESDAAIDSNGDSSSVPIDVTSDRRDGASDGNGGGPDGGAPDQRDGASDGSISKDAVTDVATPDASSQPDAPMAPDGPIAPDAPMSPDANPDVSVTYHWDDPGAQYDNGAKWN